jgi:hypothetical protein
VDPAAVGEAISENSAVDPTMVGEARAVQAVAPVIFVFVIVVLWVGGVTVVEAGSPGGFLLRRDHLLFGGGGVAVVITIVAKCPSLIRHRRGHIFFLVGILALILLWSHLGLLRRIDSIVEFKKQSPVYIESPASIPRGMSDYSVKSHERAFPRGTHDCSGVMGND